MFPWINYWRSRTSSQNIKLFFVGSLKENVLKLGTVKFGNFWVRWSQRSLPSGTAYGSTVLQMIWPLQISDLSTRLFRAIVMKRLPKLWANSLKLLTNHIQIPRNITPTSVFCHTTEYFVRYILYRNTTGQRWKYLSHMPTLVGA